MNLPTKKPANNSSSLTVVKFDGDTMATPSTTKLQAAQSNTPTTHHRYHHLYNDN
jgi:hypothetical protein